MINSYSVCLRLEHEMELNRLCCNAQRRIPALRYAHIISLETQQARTREEKLPQSGGVKPQMILDKGRDEEIGMVIARLHPDISRLTGGLTRLDQKVGL